ncbi:MAG TPA: hypothetical protein VH134_02280 [Candidatus Dormibacteraeota bacterium]|nr:hypothetical protein [Candidatus Dormibacteraeota bacterium]
MPLVVITFHDSEVLWAETPTIGFDLPVIEAEIRNVDSNSERALLPLAAIRQLMIGEVRPAPPAEILAGWDKAAFHFLDGHVLRAWLGPEVRLGPHGGVWELVEHGTPEPELRTIGVPWSSLKGVFQIRQWDSRPAGERAARAAGEPVHLENMIRVLAEREARAAEPRGTRTEASLAQRQQRAREGQPEGS